MATDDTTSNDPLDSLLGSLRRPVPTDGVPDAPAADAATSDDPLDALVGSLRRPAPKVSAPEETTAFALVDAETRRRWERSIALALGALALAGFVTDAVAASQLLADSGPTTLAAVWPIGGAGLLIAALLQARYVDRLARLPVLVWLCSAYAALFVLVGVMFATSFVPTWLAAALAWLLADQMNFLLPLVMWALAADVFSSGQGVKTFPRISRMLFAGQVAGLLVAAVAPTIFDGPDLSLAWLLVIPPIVCVGVAVLLPRALSGATTGAGHGRAESIRHTITDSLTFVRELPAFTWLLRASFLVLGAGMVLEFSFLDIAADDLSDVGDLQTFYAGTALGGFVACWLLQSFVTPRVLQRWGVSASLGVLPVATVVGAAVLVIAGATENLVVAAVGVLVWRLPRWSLDASARQTALATLPDERRARTTFLIDLVPLALALVLIPIPIGLARLIDGRWVAPTIAVVLAAVAVVLIGHVRRTWDDTQLSWRLKRRRRLG